MQHLSDVRVLTATPTDRMVWESVTEQSDDAWLGHDWRWNELVEEGVWKARPCSLIVMWGSRAVGVIPLHFSERRIGPLTRRVLASNAWGHGGPALVNDVDEPARRALLHACATAIHRMARQVRADKLLVRLPVLSRRNLLRPEDDTIGAMSLLDQSTSSLVLRIGGRSESDLWVAMEGRARTAVRKAERAGLRVRPVDADEAVARYYALHQQTYLRTGATPHPWRYFDAILRSPWSKVFFAERGNKVVAALNVGIYRNTAFYWTGASANEAGDLGANSLLQWHAIRWLCSAGYLAYELGEAAPPRPSREDRKLLSLSLFKRSFGGEHAPYRRGIFVYATLRERLAGSARRLRQKLFGR